MVYFSHSSFYLLGKIIPGWTQRISLVHVSADNTEECDIVFKQCVGGKAKKKKKGKETMHKSNMHVFNTKIK